MTTQTSHTPSEPTDQPDRTGEAGPAGTRPARRTVMRAAGMLGAGGVGAAALAACGGSTTPTTSGAAAAPSSSASASSGSSASSASGASSTAGASGGAAGTPFKAADVPVGGGVINADAQIVVTQPAAGTYKAFSAVCTHQGCVVSKVADGKIDCMCHGSQFDISTGAPVAGPAKRALTPKTATASGDTVTVA